MKTIQVPAVLDGISPLKDGGMTVRFHTQEMNDEMKLAALAYYQKFGWLMFKQSETAFTEDELPTDDPEEPKTLSQRLRAVIYLYGRDVKGIPADDKDRHREFYRQQMERVIESYKALLPPL